MYPPLADRRWDRRAVLAAMTALAAVPIIPLDAWARTAADPFVLGVASGDPAGDGFVLWTRLVGPALMPLAAGAVLARPSVRNAVVLSGDVHSFWANDLADGAGRTVASEIVTSAPGALPPPTGRFGDAPRTIRIFGTAMSNDRATS